MAIFGECLNYKSGLRILILPPEVPFFWSQKWALLAKVTVFGPQKMALLTNMQKMPPALNSPSRTTLFFSLHSVKVLTCANNFTHARAGLILSPWQESPLLSLNVPPKPPSTTHRRLFHQTFLSVKFLFLKNILWKQA